MKLIRRLALIAVAVLALLAPVAFVASSAAPAGATASCAAGVEWNTYYGGSYGTRSVSSARQPEWHVSSADYGCHYGANLYFHPNGDLVCYGYLDGKLGEVDPSGTAGIPLPGTLKFQPDGHIVIYDAYGTVEWIAPGTLAPGKDWYVAELVPDCTINVYYHANGTYYLYSFFRIHV